MAKKPAKKNPPGPGVLCRAGWCSRPTWAEVVSFGLRQLGQMSRRAGELELQRAQPRDSAKVGSSKPDEPPQFGGNTSTKRRQPKTCLTVTSFIYIYIYTYVLMSFFHLLGSTCLNSFGRRHSLLSPALFGGSVHFLALRSSARTSSGFQLKNKNKQSSKQANRQRDRQTNERTNEQTNQQTTVPCFTHLPPGQRFTVWNLD